MEVLRKKGFDELK